MLHLLRPPDGLEAGADVVDGQVGGLGDDGQVVADAAAVFGIVEGHVDDQDGDFLVVHDHPVLEAEDAAHAEHLVEHRLFEGRGGAVFGEGDGLAGGAELNMPLEAELGGGGDGLAGQRLQAVAAEGAAGVLDPRNGS